MHQFAQHSLVIGGAFSETCRRWSDMLQEPFAVCLVSDPQALRQVIVNLKPSILVLQFSMPGFGRVGGLHRIHALSPTTKTLVLADTPTTAEGIAVLKAGAKGYYTSGIEPLLLKKAVTALQNDELWIERKLISALVAGFISISDSVKVDNDRKPHSRLASMTPRQREVADAITSGKSNKEIATRLNLSERTVKAHLSELFRNFGVFDRLQLGLLLNKLPFGGEEAIDQSKQNDARGANSHAQAMNCDARATNGDAQAMHNDAQAANSDAPAITPPEDAFQALRQPILRGAIARHTTRR